MNKQLSALRITLLAITVSSASLALPSWATPTNAEELPLLREKHCHACHSVDTNLLGPPYRAISLRHAANKEAMREVLVQKIITGGGSNWGLVPMVPNEHVTEKEARKMVDWIFQLESNTEH